MIDFINATKRYGSTAAIDNMSISLREKDIYCLLGRNGAGKTTFLNLIAGKVQATAGEVSVNGTKVSTINMPENVRYIEAAKSQFNMKVADLLKLASGVDDMFDMDFACLMAKKFRLDTNKRYKALSFGMKTMVTTLISLASNDDVILLDEPVLGFDAVMRSEFYSLLTESFEKHPRVIVVSTHLIDEIAGIAGRIVMIDNGKLIINEGINELVEKSYKLTGPVDDVKITSKGLNVIATETIGKYAVSYIYDKRVKVAENIDISDLSLQELFIKLAGGEDK